MDMEEQEMLQCKMISSLTKVFADQEPVGEKFPLSIWVILYFGVFIVPSYRGLVDTFSVSMVFCLADGHKIL